MTRLTEKRLYALFSAADRGLAELEAIADEEPRYQREYEAAQEGIAWAAKEMNRRAEKKGMTYREYLDYLEERYKF